MPCERKPSLKLDDGDALQQQMLTKHRADSWTPRCARVVLAYAKRKNSASSMRAAVVIPTALGGV